MKKVSIYVDISDGIDKTIESLKKVKSAIPENAIMSHFEVYENEDGGGLLFVYYREYTLDEKEEQRIIRYNNFLSLKKEFEAQ